MDRGKEGSGDGGGAETLPNSFNSNAFFRCWKSALFIMHLFVSFLFFFFFGSCMKIKRKKMHSRLTSQFNSPIQIPIRSIVLTFFFFNEGLI